jgi:GrpB-like predicted nucleotidyltransferase (UPF0157 family)
VPDQQPIRPYPHPPSPVALRPWNPRAPEAASHVIALITERLPETTVEHVGSSAVKDCDGKGSLDLAIPYRDAEHLAQINEALFALGFERQRGRDPFPETRPMRIGAFEHKGETFLLHLHVVLEASPDLAELVDFRDRLRSDPELVARYIAAKRAVLDAGIIYGVDYAIAKGAFITGLSDQGIDSA